MKALMKLIGADVRHHSQRLLGAAVGLALASALFALLCALGLGVREGLLQQWGAAMPRTMVEVKPQGVQLGPLELSLGGLLGDGPLGPDQVQALADLPHVRAAYPVLDVPLPMAATGGASLFGKSLNTQIFVSALPTQLVGDDFIDDPQGAIPVVLHESLVTLYNTTVASALGTPRITSRALVGLGFTLVLGQSPLMAQTARMTPKRFPARIVGISPFALPLGISIPVASGRRLLDAFGDSTRGTTPLRSVLLEADGPEALSSINQEVQAMGLHVDERAAQVGQMLEAMVVVMGLVGSLALLLCGVGMAYAFAAYVSARRHELLVLRIVGASRSFVLALMLAEAVLLGACSGILGLVLARIVMAAMPDLLHDGLVRVPLLPTQLFVLPTALAALTLGLAVLTAILGALLPAWGASRMPLGQATHGA